MQSVKADGQYSRYSQMKNFCHLTKWDEVL